MEVYIWKGFHKRFFLGVLFILFLTSYSFSAPTETPETLTIQKVEVSQLAEGSRVTIEGSQPFEYTVFKLENPLRVVIEIPKMQLGKLAGSIEVKNGTVNTIRNRSIEDPQRPGSRFEVGLDKMVEYNVISEGNRLFIDLGKPSIALPSEVKTSEVKKEDVKKEEQPGKKLTKAKFLKDLVISAKADWVQVDLKGDGLMPDYKSFQLTKPTRLVVDLPKIRNASSKVNIDVGNKLLKEIRVGQHPDNARVVFVFPGSKPPSYQLVKEGQEIRVFLGQVKEELVKKEMATVAEAPKETPAAEVPKSTPASETAAQPAPKPTEVAAATTAVEKAPAKEKETVAEAKVKEIEVGKPAGNAYKGARISLDFKDADIHNIFRLIAEVSNLNVITSDDVKGKITIRLVNVPWDQALEVILSTKNLIKIEEGNVLRITTIENIRKESEDRQKEEKTLLESKKNKVLLEEPSKKIIKVNYADAIELQKLLLEKKEEGKGLLSSEGSIKADKRTNTLIIQDIRSNLEEVEQIIKELDSPTPQVLIEARVIQAVTTFARSIGVQWGGSYNQTPGGEWFWGLTGNNPSASAGWGYTPSATPGGSTPLIMPSNFVVNFPASTANTPAGGAAISFGKLTGSLVNLDLRVQLGETDGQTKVIARPKLATLDNKAAIIKQGEKIPYETTSQAGTQVQFIDAVLSLQVTPHVTPDGSILMKVKVTRDSRGTFRSPVNQVPSIDNREADTEVLVKDGETLVIGGIYEMENDQTEQGIPWLMKIPILGWLFKNQDTFNKKNELLIFITPSIIQAKPISS
jgi:type IV pilus assembly protein PilQ